MPKILTLAATAVTTTYRITSYRVDVEGPRLYIEGEIARAVGETSFTERFNYTARGEEVQAALTDGGTRTAKAIEAGLVPGAAYYAGTRDALYALLQAQGVIPINAINATV
jgi:hypothetical protein